MSRIWRGCGPGCEAPRGNSPRYDKKEKKEERDIADPRRKEESGTNAWKMTGHCRRSGRDGEEIHGLWADHEKLFAEERKGQTQNFPTCRSPTENAPQIGTPIADPKLRRP
jgi:hypothetical protein